MLPRDRHAAHAALSDEIDLATHRSMTSSFDPFRFPDWPIDNTSAPFVPKIFFKPHATVPLEVAMQPPQAPSEPSPRAALLATHLQASPPEPPNALSDTLTGLAVHSAVDGGHARGGVEAGATPVPS